jgi:GGDEF-like domain/PucR C-terminal helix-turn-helix domain
VEAVVCRLRARQSEIERAICARVREAVPAPADDVQYLEGLRAAVAGAVEFCLTGLERGEGFSTEIPVQAVAQAQRAARSGVSLDAVLRRYIVGNSLMCDYIIQECDLEPVERVSGRQLLRAQSALLERLVIGVTREHVAELQRASRSREHRSLDRVRMLLAGEHPNAGVAGGTFDAELGYELDVAHVALIARGPGARDALRDLAARLDRQLLSVVPSPEVVWAWLGGRRPAKMSELQRGVSGLSDAVSIVAGEPARGLAGWRLSHQQAKAALAVATRRACSFARYGDVALLATALKDEPLARALIDVYIAPLVEARAGDGVLVACLHAYFAAERSISSAAVALGVSRKTVESRLRAIEEKLARPLHPCPAELEVALLLYELPQHLPTPGMPTGS